MSDADAAAPSRKPSRLPVILTAVALAVVMAWVAVVVSKKRGGSAMPTLSLAVKALNSVPVRPLTDQSKVDIADALDLEITVHRKSFAYLFIIDPEQTTLAWAPTAADEAWDVGTYAPDWDGALFHRPGPTQVVVVTNGSRLDAASKWKTAELNDLRKVCPSCGHARVHLEVTGQAPKVPNLPPGSLNTYQ